MPNQVIDGRAVAVPMLEGVSSDVDKLRQDGWIPQLVSIRIGDSPRSTCSFATRSETRPRLEFNLSRSISRLIFRKPKFTQRS